MLSWSILSDHVTPWTVALQALCVHGLLQARTLDGLPFPISLKRGNHTQYLGLELGIGMTLGLSRRQ